MFLCNNSTSSMLSLEEGQSFSSGRYVLRRNMGGDDYGQVWLARDTTENHSVAVKFLPFTSGTHYPEFVSAVKKRFKTICQFEHENIVNYKRLERIELWGETDYLLSMEVPVGKNLLDYKNKLINDGDFSVGKAIDICSVIAQALDYAHSYGVLHYELRPENIFVDGDGKIKLAAFDSLRKFCAQVSLEAEHEYRSFAACSYLAPEQWLGWQRAKETLDQFALGVIFYELLRNHTPFRGKDKDKLCISVLKDTVDELDELSIVQNFALSKALSKRPSSRFSTCTDFINSLLELNKSFFIFGCCLDKIFTFEDYRKNKDYLEGESVYNQEKPTEVKLVSLDEQSLNRLAEIRTPVSLDLSKAPISSLEKLADYPNIIELRLKWCNSLTDISALKELNDLQVLDMEGCENIENLSSLAGLKKLIELHLPNRITDEQFSWLCMEERFPDLQKLFFKSCSRLTNISMIRKFSNLELVVFSWCEKIYSLEGLNKLAKLKFLEISYCDHLANVAPIGEVHDLVALKLCACRGVISLKALKSLRKLSRINLAENNNLKDISALRGMDNLKRLSLASCKSLADISPLEGLDNLELLSLSDCVNLSELNSLIRARHLKVLNLAGCRKITDAIVLMHLKNLMRVNFSGCSKIGFMQKRKLKKLLPKCQITF